MQVEFYKYQGTGNDFVMIDNRSDFFPKKDTKLIERLCDRRFGIGADGLILLENDSETDFRMVYYNADGNQSSMCGNGGRCLVAFAKKLDVIENETTFIATDGLHHATIAPDSIVSLQMIDVDAINKYDNYTFLNTGSPHHVQIVDDLEHYNVKENGAAIRYGELYGKPGSNINFVKKVDDKTFSLRTYERGVEDETLACGTGATAVAIAMNAIGETNETDINLNVEGGKLVVSFDKVGEHFTNVFLKGPAEFVFKGTIEI
ncbi:MULTISPECIES: diaminopimelate epimerase [unclassified Flavobacterium]|uniref:diaminopimelate epimerase n=1 Tax=unclassified Flavobacterium TaxID=196869 RepID=UPI00057FC946|nr:MULTISPECIES: diaminopimelate epimerase [unclassified Flavobacterium]KIC00309.1 diaminopimelate epimerase [Flavobacterium sp. KMS]MEA9411694.1 diaminopimelate epimerase [Flavobacterium sp. PL02]OUL61407.1 diaminopimelate epimerase [Flavobacterium sp. AJR]